MKKRNNYSSVMRDSIIVIVVTIVAAAGLYLLQGSNAATSYLSSEAEAGLLAACASNHADTTASGGAAVLFGTTACTKFDQKYEAENSTTNLPTEATWANYSGSGYLASWNASGQYATFTVTVPATGIYTLGTRYSAGGGGTSRVLTVNGTVISSAIPLGATADWNTWKTATTGMTLNAGSNTITLSYDPSSGSNYVNLDYIEVTAGAPPPGPVNIMPLGDSITTGYQSSDGGGWRTYINSDLTKAGYNFALVGDRVDGPANIGNDDGYPGWTCANLESNISSFLTSTPPQIVMLECGANDIETGTSPSGAANRIATLIDMIQTQMPKTYVILANLTPININSTYNSYAQQVNALLPSIVSTRQSEGRPISFVDMYDNMDQTNNGVFPDINSGSDHPDDAGYSEMAQVWWPALVKAIAAVNN
jgi:lysophospholipase L1-like esterase